MGKDKGIQIQNVSNVSSFDLSSALSPLRKVFCSATLTNNPTNLAFMNLNNFVCVSPSKHQSEFKYILPESISLEGVVCSKDKRDFVLKNILKDKIRKRSFLIFFNALKDLHRNLNTLRKMFPEKDSVLSLSSRQRVDQRSAILKNFNARKQGCLLTTDLMTRGIDFQNLDVVVSYDIVVSKKGIVHRVGRTGRAGRKGKCIFLLEESKKENFSESLAKLGRKFKNITSTLL